MGNLTHKDTVEGYLFQKMGVELELEGERVRTKLNRRQKRQRDGGKDR